MVREAVMSIDLEGSACEAEAARLLPWFITGRLSAADSERVARHLEHCAVCRSDLGHDQALRAALKSEGPVEYAPQAGLATTLARINELTREAPSAGSPPAAARPARRRATTQWLTAAVIVQAIGLGVLGSALLGHSAADRASARYETLSAPAPAAHGPRIRAVFAPATTLAELKTLLAAHRLVIADGPSAAGALTLVAADAAELEPLLAALRADRNVLFAEPALNDGAAAR
jgi:anti-sigma factor RsiW